MKVTVKELVIFSLCTGLIFSSQVALAFLPNIELVSLLFILYGIHFRWKAFYIVYAFVLLEGFFYGFGFWWLMYLYIWNILVLLAIKFKDQTSPLFWAILSGLYGLSFGAIGTLPFLFTGLLGENGSLSKSLNLMLSYWISGIPFDIAHSIGNFFIALFLFFPLNKIFHHSLKTYFKS